MNQGADHCAKESRQFLERRTRLKNAGGTQGSIGGQSIASALRLLLVQPNDITSSPAIGIAVRNCTATPGDIAYPYPIPLPSRQNFLSTFVHAFPKCVIGKTWNRTLTRSGRYTFKARLLYTNIRPGYSSHLRFLSSKRQKRKFGYTTSLSPKSKKSINLARHQRSRVVIRIQSSECPVCTLKNSSPISNIILLHSFLCVEIGGNHSSSATLPTNTLALLLFFPNFNRLSRFLTLPTLLPTLVAVSGL